MEDQKKDVFSFKSLESRTSDSLLKKVVPFFHFHNCILCTFPQPPYLFLAFILVPGTIASVGVSSPETNHLLPQVAHVYMWFGLTILTMYKVLFI